MPLAAFGDDVGGTDSRPRSVRASWRPMRMMREAPMSLAERTAERPTAPSPITVTVWPGLMPAFLAAWYPVDMTSERLKQRRDQLLIEAGGDDDEGARCLWDPGEFALTAVVVAAPVRTVAAGGLQAFLAEVAGAVGGDEWSDDKVTHRQARHLGSEFFDDADEFVAHAGSFSGLRPEA